MFLLIIILIQEFKNKLNEWINKFEWLLYYEKNFVITLSIATYRVKSYKKTIRIIVIKEFKSHEIKKN